MSVKEMAIETISGLPEDISWSGLEERLRFVAGVEQARAEVKAGSVVPHEEVGERLEEWLRR